MFKVFYSVYSSVTLDAYLGCIDTLLLRQTMYKCTSQHPFEYFLFKTAVNQRLKNAV